MLRLQAGSTEAGYLAAIFPLPKTPTLVMMNKGELKEYIAAGVSKEDFVSRTAKALRAASQQQPPAAPASARPDQPASASPAPAPTPLIQPASASPQPAPGAPSAPSDPQPSPQVQALLAERAARLEVLRAEQRKREAEQRRQDKAKAKEEASPASSSSSSKKPKDPAQEKYSAELKQRQQQAREDRARVLQAIEDDKAARRARASERRTERMGLAAAAAPMSELLPERKKTEGGDGVGGGACRLQIRLFDGSTVRGEWKGTQTLGGDVRGWLEGQPGMKGLGGTAYGFKVILTPRPSKTIGAGEEGKTLQELGLTPSATLVLVPAAGMGAGAYPGTAGGNTVTRVIMAILGVFTGFWALIAGFFGGLFSSGPAPAAVQDNETAAAAAATGRDQDRKGALRQLRPEWERRNEQQFYNGNSVRLLDPGRLFTGVACS